MLVPKENAAKAREALRSAMPRLLTKGHKTPKEEMREILNEVKPKPPRDAEDLGKTVGVLRWREAG